MSSRTSRPEEGLFANEEESIDGRKVATLSRFQFNGHCGGKAPSYLPKSEAFGIPLPNTISFPSKVGTEDHNVANKNLLLTWRHRLDSFSQTFLPCSNQFLFQAIVSLGVTYISPD